MVKYWKTSRKYLSRFLSLFRIKNIETMTTQEQFQLVFKKIRDEDGDIFFYAEHIGNINHNVFIARLWIW